MPYHPFPISVDTLITRSISKLKGHRGYLINFYLAGGGKGSKVAHKLNPLKIRRLGFGFGVMINLLGTPCK